MLIAAVATYVLLDRKEDQYKSNAMLSTGIVDITGVNIEKENPFIQKFYIDMGFSKLKELIGSHRNVAFLTFQLLLHDLPQQEVNAETPFRTIKDKEDIDFSYSDAEINMLIQQLRNNLDSLKYTFDNPAVDQICKDLAKAYGYDYETLIENNLTVSRRGDSDLLEIEFRSENAKLSHFATNTFVQEFLRNYIYIEQEQESSTVAFLNDQVRQKKIYLDSLQRHLEWYRDNNNIIDLKGESQTVIAQIKDLELNKEAFIQKIPALRKNIATINSYLKENDQYSVADEAVKLNSNQALSNIVREIKEMTAQYIASGYKDKKLERRIALFRKQQEDYTKRLAKIDQEQENRLDNREEDLLSKRIEMELEASYAEQSVESINNEIIRLRQKAASFVSAEAYISTLEQEIEITQVDYKQVVHKYNTQRRQLESARHPVKVFQWAQLAEKPESKMKAIISGFAGIVSGTVASVIIFLLAFMDYSINSPHKFHKFANLPLIGTLNRIKSKNLDLKQVFASNSSDKKMAAFKESVRNLRFAMENSGGKRFLFTSTKDQEGKTFTIVTLAYSLTMKNKKVLLVDTNFKNNTLTKMSRKSDQLIGTGTQAIGDSNLDEEFEVRDINSSFNLDNVDIIGNKGSFQSPSEVFAEKDFMSFIDRMSNNYDFVLMESASMNSYSDTKELVEYVDKVIAVFAAESEIKQADKNSIEFLRSLGGKFMGAVLNKVDLKNLV